MDQPERPDMWWMEIAGETLAVLEFATEPAGGVGLSEAEKQIVALVAEGLTNAQIASARGTSPRTVANQIARLLLKCGAGSRHELAGRAR